jgi:Cu/Ag efflux pump CusA
VREQMAKELPEVSAYFQSGGLVDAVLSLGMAAPIDVKVAGSDQTAAMAVATQLARRIRLIPNVADAYIPQDLDYPALKLDIDRTRAQELGLTQKEVVDNVITALTSNAMIAPSYWIDPKNGNDYMLTEQYPERQIKSLDDLRAIPVRGEHLAASTRLDAIFLDQPLQLADRSRSL